MQKKIIALAVAGLVSGAAFAQSNVTIFGALDVSYGYARGDSGNTQNANGVNSPVDALNGVSGTRTWSGLQNGKWNGSRVGFRGEEGLGNGLKAVFWLEYGADVLGGAASALAGSRQSWVGLETGFGRLYAGKIYSPTADGYLGDFSVFEAAGNTPLAMLANNVMPMIGGTMSTDGNARINNAIGWKSNNYSGFSGQAYYAFGQTSSATGFNRLDGATTYATTANTATVDVTDNGRFGGGVKYMNGPLSVAAAYQASLNVRQTYPSVNAATDFEGNDINEWMVSAGYDLKFVKLNATYQETKNKNNSTSTATYVPGIDAKIFSAGALVPVTPSGAGKFLIEYAKLSLSQSSTAQPVAALQKEGSSSVWGVGFRYDFSKRTMSYTTLSKINNDSDSFDLGANGVGVRGESSYIFQTGLRHFF